MKKYFYDLLFSYLSIYIKPDNKVVEINPRSLILAQLFKNIGLLFLDKSLDVSADTFEKVSSLKEVSSSKLDFVLINGDVHYQKDLSKFFADLYKACIASTRVVITYYSNVWRPFIFLATVFGWRRKAPEQNWITHHDIANLLALADFEIVHRDSKVLCPVPIPLISHFLNRYLAPLPFFRQFCLVNILIARPLGKRKQKELSVSVIVPARNEEGNIEQIVQRLPKMGPDDELIFVEGHSQDETWVKIEEVAKKYRDQLNIKVFRQEGKGKGDAVRKGFEEASKDILMILDADLTVAPEDLLAFYTIIVHDKGEFINGSRLVYPLEDRSMRFFNILGNKFFATAFSYVLGQRFKDTLCGTKVISRENYRKLAAHRSFFGDFDPFGDFDLIFGAVRLCLKVTEMPIRYCERTYGTTNIQRWKHGALLLRMLLYASKKMKFI